MAKQYKVNGFIQNVQNGAMSQLEFIVSASNDTHCTVSIAPSNPNLPVQYCVDFTEVLKDLKKRKQL